MDGRPNEGHIWFRDWEVMQRLSATNRLREK
jgi:hypothetical protein